ncbi:translation initiation factor eIF3 subunit [Tilletiaria anomala UBC 951]|uniref:Eukaryotic translation initiation factor 3 30 kDa subunit n=1 Tax=Tilletiaria anomala (strain ATCC 24038 / CBS 436.72 / UBC 951) TaxID=1037660 RepID=A0A066VN16_TILAU|nr:translation initiation factor eIF3 subunit [Tilletiaria anomala UBC 951]KDN40169.1 translation initiation factor eIF3 subunit [Tilletiaria anomala UBC 951]
MSDWDASSDEETSKKVTAPSAVTMGRRRFDDEEDEVKDDWEEEDEKPQEPAPLAPAKKKGTLKQKLAEKEAAEKRRQELGLESDDENQEDEEDPAEKRRLEREAQLKADMDNAANLLGQNRISSSDDPTLNKLLNAKPVSKEDWDSFSTQLFEQLIKPQTSRTGFDKHFAPHLITLLSAGMRDTDMRLASAKLKDLAEKKAKAEKEAKKAGGQVKKPKPKNNSTASAKDKIDTANYADAVEEDLDFM